MTRTRLKAATKAALIHFAGGLVVAALVATLIFGLWFPYPYYVISGGGTLFFILCGVDVVCGPLLTFVLYSPTKQRKKWLIDIGLILTIQFSALVYGLHSIALTRPVWLAFEGDRFRIIRATDLHGEYLSQAEHGFNSLSWTGPRLVTIREIEKTDPAFLESVQRALQGDPPAFWPQRWIDYADRADEVRKAIYPLSLLYNRPGYETLRHEVQEKTGLPLAQQDIELGYLPMVQQATMDWVVVIDKKTARPVAYAPVDGW